jgi:type IV secretory pathway TrbL component
MFRGFSGWAVGSILHSLFMIFSILVFSVWTLVFDLALVRTMVDFALAVRADFIGLAVVLQRERAFFSSISVISGSTLVSQSSGNESPSGESSGVCICLVNAFAPPYFCAD